MPDPKHDKEGGGDVRLSETGHVMSNHLGADVTAI
jgi:hypothetical protein